LVITRSPPEAYGRRLYKKIKRYQQETKSLKAHRKFLKEAQKMGEREQEFAEKVLKEEFGEEKTKIVDLLTEIKLPMDKGRKSVFFITLFL
jgi:hypothetical protein